MFYRRHAFSSLTLVNHRLARLLHGAIFDQTATRSRLFRDHVDWPV
jgi:hypothetical protein